MTQVINFLQRLRRKLYCFFLSLGKAKAASELARLGYYDQAREVMLIDDKKC